MKQLQALGMTVAWRVVEALTSRSMWLTALFSFFVYKLIGLTAEGKINEGLAQFGLGAWVAVFFGNVAKRTILQAKQINGNGEANKTEE